jgi:hypothetical protein
LGIGTLGLLSNWTYEYYLKRSFRKKEAKWLEVLDNSITGILSANEQIVNFFILYSADGFGQTGREIL